MASPVAGFRPFLQKRAHTQPLYIVNLEIDTEAPSNDEFDVRSLYLKEQIEQGCLEVGYGNHGCTV